eukprot:g11479.t1
MKQASPSSQSDDDGQERPSVAAVDSPGPSRPSQTGPTHDEKNSNGSDSADPAAPKGPRASSLHNRLSSLAGGITGFRRTDSHAKLQEREWVPKDLMGVGEIDGTLSLDDDEADAFEVEKKNEWTRFKCGACRCLFWSSSLDDYRTLKSIWFHFTALMFIGAFWGLYYIFNERYMDYLGDDPDLVLYILVFIALASSVAYGSVLLQAALIATVLGCMQCPCCYMSPVAEVMVVRGFSSIAFLATVIVLMTRYHEILSETAPEERHEIILAVLQSTLAFGCIFTLVEICEHALLAYINNNAHEKMRKAELETKRAILHRLIGNRPMSKSIEANSKSNRVVELRKAVLAPGVRINAEQANLITWLVQGQGDHAHHSINLTAQGHGRNSIILSAQCNEENGQHSEPPSPSKDLSTSADKSALRIMADTSDKAVQSPTDEDNKDGKERKTVSPAKGNVWGKARKSVLPFHFETLTKGINFSNLKPEQVEETSNYKIQFDYMLLDDSRYLAAQLAKEKPTNPDEYDQEEYVKYDGVLLGLADFERVFKPATARFAWKMFMKVPGENMGQAQVIQALKGFYSEVLGIETASMAFPAMGTTLHFVFRLLAVILWGISLLSIFNYDIGTSLLTLLTLSGFFTLALGGVITDVTSSVIMALWQQPYMALWQQPYMALWQQPYMVGDRIIISSWEEKMKYLDEKMKYWVMDITLLTTTCKDSYGRIHIFPNSKLAHERIINLSRTPEATIEIVITIGFYTPEEKLREFVLRVTNYISSKRLLFKPKLNSYLYGFDRSRDLTIGFWFVHRANAASPEVFNAKSQLQEFMREQLMDLEIAWRPLPQGYIKMDGGEKPFTFGPAPVAPFGMAHTNQPGAMQDTHLTPHA